MLKKIVFIQVMEYTLFEYIIVDILVKIFVIEYS